MKKRTKKLLRIWSFWISIIIWIFSWWIIFVTQSLSFLEFIISKDNVIFKHPIIFAGILLTLSNGYIIWRFAVHKKFPPY